VTDLSQAAVAVKKNPTMKDLVEQQLPAIERQLGGAMNSDAFVRAVLSEITKQPKLMTADPKTVLGGVMLAAQLRLEIGSGLGEFYLTPRKDHGRDICLPIIGFQGMVKLALRSEFVTNVQAFLVREAHANRRHHLGVPHPRPGHRTPADVLAENTVGNP
jgi:recombination protein RecT